MLRWPLDIDVNELCCIFVVVFIVVIIIIILQMNYDKRKQERATLRAKGGLRGRLDVSPPYQVVRGDLPGR